ncbi:zinc-binding dehydrogenase [Ruminococcaceae bacterium OttesenSCG-928-O06]|nr:zinc-binding dehydrogenase [Ruminococcaceae bacterium OttesenSCG-928-O06]
MKSAVFYGNEQIKIEERPNAKVGPRMAKAKIAYCAICGSEANLFSHPRMGQPNKRIAELGLENQGPFAWGHECAGVIVEVGKEVTALKVGDRVAINPIVSCGKCHYCRNGLGNICEAGYALIGSALDGGMAETICLPQENFYVIPDDMTLEDASLVQCGAVSFGSVMDSGIKMGETALVIGVGTIGLMTVQALLVAGARRIIAADIAPHKLQMAKDFGATHTIDAKEDVCAFVRELTDGRGVDFVYECAGAEASMLNAVMCVRKRGTIMVESVFYDKVPVPGIPFLQREVNVTTSVSPFAGRYDYMVELAHQGKMDAKKLLTKRVDLDHTLDGFHALRDDKSQIKVMIDVDPSLGK